MFFALVSASRKSNWDVPAVTIDLTSRTLGRCAAHYDGVASVKRHVEFTSRGGLFFSSPKRNSSLSFISTKARFVNLAVNVGSTNHLFGLPMRGTMIRSSDAAIARGSKAPNQPSDELAFTRVAPGLPCLRTSCA